jgi:hypothetical protein
MKNKVYVWGGGKLLPKRIEYFKNENAPLIVALGSSHYAVITVEKELYTWSVNIIFYFTFTSIMTKMLLTSFMFRLVKDKAARAHCMQS